MRSDTELCFTPARKLAQMIRARKLSATELTRAFIAQVERVNPEVNAIVTFLPEEALRAARAMDRKKDRRGALASLPIAFKDLVPTKGVRTTFGSPVFTRNVPQDDHAIVTRLTAEGAIMIGKTNTPEFGAGEPDLQQSVWRDPQSLRPRQDLRRLVGRRGRGRGLRHAALRRRIRSRREPAQPGNYCNVVGFRPTPGRIPAWPAANAWNTLSVLGPWPARLPTVPFFSARWPDRIRARPSRSPSRVAPSWGHCGEISGKFAAPGAAISAACRWTRA